MERVLAAALLRRRWVAWRAELAARLLAALAAAAGLAGLIAAAARRADGGYPPGLEPGSAAAALLLWQGFVQSALFAARAFLDSRAVLHASARARRPVCWAAWCEGACAGLVLGLAGAALSPASGPAAAAAAALGAAGAGIGALLGAGALLCPPLISLFSASAGLALACSSVALPLAAPWVLASSGGPLGALIASARAAPPPDAWPGALTAAAAAAAAGLWLAPRLAAAAVDATHA